MFDLSERMWLFYGLFFATVILMSLGSNGIGTGGYFQAWDGLLNVVRSVATLELFVIIVSAISSVLPLALTVGTAAFGAYVFSKTFGSGGTASTIESMAGGLELKNLPVFLVFLLFVLLLI